jgi:hypothetical protein
LTLDWSACWLSSILSNLVDPYSTLSSLQFSISIRERERPWAWERRGKAWQRRTPWLDFGGDGDSLGRRQETTRQRWRGGCATRREQGSKLGGEPWSRWLRGRSD